MLLTKVPFLLPRSCTVQSSPSRFEGEVLAGKAGVFGKAQFGGAGAADGQAAAGERNGLHLPVGTLDEKFTGHGAFLGNGDKHLL